MRVQLSTNGNPWKGKGLATLQLSGSFQEWSGPLAGCVKQYLAKPDSQKSLYDIMVGEDAGVGETILGSPVINEIAQREDFPR